MSDRYERINWENDPSIRTPLNEVNLNKMDKAISDIDIALSQAEKSVLSLGANKQDKLTPGKNITISEDNVISATGGGGTGSDIEWNQMQTEGIKIAEITIDDNTTEVFAPDGVKDYLDLDNKPTINNVELSGNKTASDLGLASAQSVTDVNSRIDEYEQSGYLPKNLFVKEKVVNGYYYNSSGALSAQSGWGYENIPINGGNSYTISNKGSISSNVQNVWLDSNGDFISIASSRGVASPYTVEAPNNAKYLGVSLIVNSALATYELDIFQVEKGTEATPYTPYAKPNTELTEIVEDAIEGGYIDLNLNVNGISHKNISANGESYTASNNYFSLGNPISIKGGNTITISSDVSGSSEIQTYVGLWDKNGNWIARSQIQNLVNGKVTYTLPDNVGKLYVFFYNASTNINGTYIKIEYGSSATPHIPSNTELQSEIDEINTVTVLTPTVGSAVSARNVLRLSVLPHIASLQFTGTINASANTWVNILTFDAKYAPKVTISALAIQRQDMSNPLLVELRENGAMMIQSPNELTNRDIRFAYTWLF